MSKEKFDLVKKQINIFATNNIDDTNNSELKLDNINSSNDRRKLHEYAQSLNLSTESHFYENSQNKYMIIKKISLDKTLLNNIYNPNQITSDFINFFIKYTEIPFPTSLPEHFDYFVELLDPYYDVKSKLNLLYDDLKSIDSKSIDSKSIDSNLELNYQNLSKYKKILWNIKEKIKNHIESNAEYQNFLNNVTKSKPNLPQILYNKQRTYIDQNLNKILLSVDIKSANFRVMKHFCPSLVNKNDEWSDFIGRIINEEFPELFSCNFLKQSKPFRTILMNELNRGLFNSYAIIFINDIIEGLKSHEIYNWLKIVSCQNDEIIFEIDQIEQINMNDMADLINNIHNFTKIKLFTLKKIYNQYNYYVTESLDNKFDSFKNISRIHIAQSIKTYEKNNITELDLKYTNDVGQIITSELLC